MVRSVEVDGVMALVELEAGPFLVTAAITRDAVEELGLAPGVPATAAVKATSVMIGADRSAGSSAAMALPAVALGAADAAATTTAAASSGSEPTLVVSAASSMTEALDGVRAPVR